MLFNSFGFLLFFPLISLVYFIVPKRFRTVYLHLASYYFYMNWNPVYVLLIASSTIITYAYNFSSENIFLNDNKNFEEPLHLNFNGAQIYSEFISPKLKDFLN